MMAFLNPLTWIADLTFSGLGHALWMSVWQWGLGVFLIIACVAAAYFLPVGKQYFIGAAVLVGIVLVIFGWGQRTEKVICDARVKYVYLRDHPKVNPRTAFAKKSAPVSAPSGYYTNQNGLPCSVFGGC